ncbi:MAG: hypothetical protein JOY61_22310 [Chloroflexi bacterium]|nr:hypothetical protein [Chloroflexota bacterium]
MYLRTSGNPFFATEVLASAESGLPPTVRDAVLARAARLSPAAQEVLHAAAVVGSRIETWLLVRMGLGEASHIDECLSLGMLVGQDATLAFRHELVRLAILETMSPARRVDLHLRALDALRSVPSGRQEPARLAHHAEGAGDCSAILEHAPVAARQAAVATAHREAATLYRLALGCADDLPPAERAELLEAYSSECNVIDERSDAIRARRTAVSLWREAVQPLKQAESLARLVPMLIGIGQHGEAERCSREAVALLAPLPRGPEFALASRTQALVALARRDADAAIRWGERAIELATHCGDHEVAGMTHSAVGSAWLILEYDRGREYLERFLADTRERGEARHAANALAHLGKRSAETYHLEHAAHDLAQGLTFTDGRDLDMYQLFMRAWQALTLLHQGRWCESATVARAVLLRCGMSAVNRLPALVAFGRLYARAGLAEAHDALRDAREIAEPIGTSETFGLVSAACAEAAWLAAGSDAGRGAGRLRGCDTRAPSLGSGRACLLALEGGR